MPQVQGGQIRAYAVTATKRIAAGPDIPTVDEAGLPGYHIWLWSGMWVPKGTANDVVATLNAAMREALTEPAVLKRFADLGFDAAPSDRQTPEALRAHQVAEADKWWPMIKAAGVKPGG
jgi:tripartite-type tricarboxylate transporter receptor subunit TctC